MHIIRLYIIIVSGIGITDTFCIFVYEYNKTEGFKMWDRILSQFISPLKA